MMTDTAIPAQVLDPKEHSRIIANFEQICTQAGIQGHFLSTSMRKYCKEVEYDWVFKFWDYKREGRSGLLLHGVNRPDTRCQAMTGALIRHYIDARVIPANTLLEYINEGRVPSPTVLLIPNLYMKIMGKSAYKMGALYDVLLERSVRGKPTVAYVEDLTALGEMYGEPFRDFLSRFIEVKE